MKKTGLTLCALWALFAAAGCGAKSTDTDDDSAGGAGPAGGTGGTGASAGMLGTGGSAGMKPALVCPDGSEPIDPTAMIDDMEDGEALLPLRDGRNGGW